MKNIYPLLLIMTILLTACAPQISLGDSTGKPVSWFDSPLPGTVLESVSEIPAVQLISHHSDQTGISEIEFSVNDEIFESAEVQGDDSLITDTRDWTPPGPGEYTLRVRALSKDGSWGNYAETYILVPNFEDLVLGGGIVQGVVYAGLSQSPLNGVAVTLKGCGPDQTQTTAADGAFNFTGLPTGSCTVEVFKQDWSFISSFPDLGQYPVPVASDPNLPTAFSITMDLTNPFPEQQSGFNNPRLSVAQVFTGECSPNLVSFDVSLVNPSDEGSVLLFFKLDNPNGNSTGWSSGTTMNSVGGGSYQTTLSGEDLAQGASYEQGTVHYQFVLETSSGDPSEYLRSAVFSNLAWAACNVETQPEPEEEVAECSDGIDNDGDGRIDYAAPSILGGTGDSGCSSPDDDNEAR